MPDIDRKDPKYKAARRKAGAWLAFIQSIAMMTKSEEDDEYASLFADIVNEHFDEAWAVHYPPKMGPKAK